MRRLPTSSIAEPVCGRWPAWPAASRASATCSRREPRRLAVFGSEDTYRALAEFSAEMESTIVGDDLRRRLTVPLADVRRLLATGLQIDLVQRDQKLHFAAARPQAAARDIGGAERDLSRLVNDGYRTFVVFRHPGEAHAGRLPPAEPGGRGARGSPRASLPRPASTSSPRRCARASSAASSSWPSSASAPCCAPLPASGASSAARASPASSTCAPATSWCTKTTASLVFAGLDTRTVAGVTRDYLLLHFKGEDKLFVPHDQLGKVTRYIGAGAGAPPLNRLGGSAWQAVKTRARKAVAEMAGELLNLYAARQAVPGLRLSRRRRADGRGSRAPSPGRRPTTRPRPSTTSRTTWRRRTPWTASSAATSATARPRSPCAPPSRRPRAASRRSCWCPPPFWRSSTSPPSASASPTFPCASRWSAASARAAEQRAILRDFAAGKVDVLIGTHRLLSTDVIPKDLGLVIVDEEQRFGVQAEGAAAQPQAAGRRA